MRSKWQPFGAGWGAGESATCSGAQTQCGAGSAAPGRGSPGPASHLGHAARAPGGVCALPSPSCPLHCPGALNPLFWPLRPLPAPPVPPSLTELSPPAFHHPTPNSTLLPTPSLGPNPLSAPTGPVLLHPILPSCPRTTQQPWLREATGTKAFLGLKKPLQSCSSEGRRALPLGACSCSGPA